MKARFVWIKRSALALIISSAISEPASFAKTYTLTIIVRWQAIT